jgi:hypothetical protein
MKARIESCKATPQTFGWYVRRYLGLPAVPAHRAGVLEALVAGCAIGTQVDIDSLR